MWLLGAKTMQLVRFDDENRIPRYAILSHTWAEEEISFEEIKNGPSKDSEVKLGWTKIEGTCRQALKHGYDYVWIDTCCIDKSSSAELQEAINSMFKWYEHAEICITYLADVCGEEDPRIEGSHFRKCRWFTRGWTLQELLAPQRAVFLDKQWKEIGNRENLQDIIRDITGIQSCFVNEQDSNVQLKSAYDRISGASVAERMSWAAERQTTRKEDLAYCLLGIFDINMTMLYG